ncbi:hypothetical protein AK830_g7936 [Neonectria ditissima]|uniref:Uncharacterized protein n=1 Tax=Neonectria ditissima TaxID=78410 RepID=A0A0P7BDY2_9HYPO|nr:hypothetical protein AK830_g7936 [Neonectria ditissima]
MNSLKVPESGWQLEGKSGQASNLPPQAFALTLSDNVIEDMIKFVQNGVQNGIPNGKGLKLALGANPSFIYDSKSHAITPPADPFPFDLYLARPFDSIKIAHKLPHAGSLFEKPKDNAPVKVSASKADRDADVKSKAVKTSKSSTPSALDSDREVLQSEMAAITAGREKARVVGKLPTKRGATKAKGKLLPGYSSTPRSIPTSPGHISLGSPTSTPALSASQQHFERVKEQRVILVHELAAQDRPLDYLSMKWTGKEEELRPTLEKVADNIADTKQWAMKKTYWKELDVWNYEYDTQELRQKAIDNAVRQYDKQRLSSNEPEWQKLLPKDERGKGKCLSRLQANLAKGPSQPTPKIKVQKADGSPASSRETESLDGDRPKSGGESMSRSASNPLPSKTKKASGQEAQVKRLFSSNKAKAAAAAKTSPTKGRVAATKATGGRVLSSEYILNSDSSGDDAPAAAKPKPKPAPATKTKETVIARPRPVPREPVKQQTAKRPREDDDSSSSSGTPLSKRIKPKQPLPAQRLKQRPSDASQNSRGNGTGTASSSLKSKNTSPTKSSPLASSPPTNASDLENDAPLAPPVTKKRKMQSDVKAPPPKRAAVARISDELVQKAQRFKTVYEKYEMLHYEVSALNNPPKDRLGQLEKMRDRLKVMKMEIYQECPPNRA